MRRWLFLAAVTLCVNSSCTSKDGPKDTGVKVAPDARPKPDAIVPMAHGPTMLPDAAVPDEEGDAGTQRHADQQKRIEEFCTACHLYAGPQAFPKWYWERTQVIEKMYALAGIGAHESGVPPASVTREYFLDRAPKFVLLPNSKALGPGTLKLKPHRISPKSAKPEPQVSHVALVPGENGRQDVLLCNVQDSVVMVVRPWTKPVQTAVVAKVAVPSHAELVDLDGDGFKDLIVAELGTLLPEEHDKGQLIWFRGTPDGKFAPMVVLDRVGRIGDFEAGDVDGDGDIDLVVAVFGWRRTGSFLLLENQGRDRTGRPLFKHIELDKRSGSLGVNLADIDGDGRMDIVAMITQQYEEVVAYLNRGASRFEPVVLFKGPNPDFGLMWAHTRDLDGDGDIDVLFVNGDVLDTSQLQPHHGVRWVENLGKMQFKLHELGALPGAAKVATGDLDGDGDLDIVASAYIPFPNKRVRNKMQYESLIWFEQTSKGQFERHSLETITADHAALAVGDVDGDGDVDIVAGNMLLAGSLQDGTKDWMVWYENRRVP